MKKLIYILAFIPFIVKAQHPNELPQYVDSVGRVRIATIPLSQVAISGYFSNLLYKPTTLTGYGITDAYPLSGNPSSFLTGITSAQVIGALGYTPYNSTNPSNYITGSSLASYLTTSIAASTYQTIGAYLTANQSISLSGDVTGTGTTAITTVLKNTGTAGTYPKVTTDVQGRVTSGTTLSPSDIPISAGTGISIVSGVITNTSPNQTVTLTAGNGIAISGTYPNFTVAVVQPTITTPTRALNTSFTPNTTKSTLGIYGVTLSVTNPLLAGTSSCAATLQYSTDGGTTWKSAPAIGESSNVGVTVTLQLTQGQTGYVIGMIPAGALCKISTTTSGTATVTIGSCEEIVY